MFSKATNIDWNTLVGEAFIEANRGIISWKARGKWRGRFIFWSSNSGVTLVLCPRLADFYPPKAPRTIEVEMSTAAEYSIAYACAVRS